MDGLGVPSLRVASPGVSGLEPIVRSSSRIGLVSAVLLATVAGIAAGWLLYGPAERPDRPVHVPLKVEPPPGAASGELPSAETVSEMLDRVEAAEVERFGEAEAARRRRTREQLVEGRLHPEHR